MAFLVQELGLASGGAEGIGQRCGQGYGDDERRGSLCLFAGTGELVEGVGGLTWTLAQPRVAVGQDH